VVGLGLLARAGQRSSRSLTQRRASTVGQGDIEDAVPFELRGFSLATLFIIGGVALIVFSFVDYFAFGTGGGFGIGGLTFIYAVPVLLLGAALSYAELAPVEVETEPDAKGLFEAKATPTLQKILKDVTRHRYGDDAHLDSSLKALGLTGAGRYPQLKKVILSKSPEDELEFTMLFQSKDVPFTTWADPMKTVACDRFFGPGIWSSVSKFSSEKRIAALKLTTGTRPGTGEGEKGN